MLACLPQQRLQEEKGRRLPQCHAASELAEPPNLGGFGRCAVRPQKQPQSLRLGSEEGPGSLAVRVAQTAGRRFSLWIRLGRSDGLRHAWAAGASGRGHARRSRRLGARFENS